MKVIVINGAGGSGKDTFVELAATYASTKGFRVINLSTIDEIKEIAREMGWRGGKEDKDRTFLCELKRVWKEYNEMYLKNIFQKISVIEFEEEYLNEERYIFIHSREPKEIEEIREYVNNRKIPCCTLIIERDGIKEFSNDSDRLVKEFEYDFYVENNGTIDQLNEEVKNFLAFLSNWSEDK